MHSNSVSPWMRFGFLIGSVALIYLFSSESYAQDELQSVLKKKEVLGDLSEDLHPLIDLTGDKEDAGASAQTAFEDTPTPVAQAVEAVATPTPVAADRPFSYSIEETAPALEAPANSIVNDATIDQATPVAAGSTTSARSYRLGLSTVDKDGVAVMGVIVGSPAAKAGIQPGDKLLSISGTPLSTANEIADIVGAQSDGTSFPMTIRRKGRVSVVNVRLATFENVVTSPQSAVSPSAYQQPGRQTVYRPTIPSRNNGIVQQRVIGTANSAFPQQAVVVQNPNGQSTVYPQAITSQTMPPQPVQYAPRYYQQQRPVYRQQQQPLIGNGALIRNIGNTIRGIFR